MHFIDLQKQYQEYKHEILAEINKVFEKCAFIGGPFLKKFEEELTAHSGVKHAIGCASGTDALLLGLWAKNVEPGNEIIVPDFTFFATAETIALIGAIPVFIDVDCDTYNIDTNKIEEKITQNTKGIVPVSLFGQCADMDVINSIAEKYNLWVMEDGAQSYGAEYKGKKSCTLSDLGITSFFPAKPLGAYGDGGALFTADDELADKIKMLLNHGQSERYQHTIIGTNARLDALQAAILSVKLRHFDQEMEAKRRVAEKYTRVLKDTVTTPIIKPDNVSVWAQYTIRVERRYQVFNYLNKKGIPTAIHYPIPLHKQRAFSYLNQIDEQYPVSEKISKQVLSLPMHPFLSDEDIEFVTEGIREALK